RRGLHEGRLDQRGPGDHHLPAAVPLAGRALVRGVSEGRRRGAAIADRAHHGDGGAGTGRGGALSLMSHDFLLPRAPLGGEAGKRGASSQSSAFPDFPPPYPLTPTLSPEGLRGRGSTSPC